MRDTVLAVADQIQQDSSQQTLLCLDAFNQANKTFRDLKSFMGEGANLESVEELKGKLLDVAKTDTLEPASPSKR